MYSSSSGSINVDSTLMQRVTSSGYLPQLESSPSRLVERAVQEGGVAVLEQAGLLSRARDRGNTEVGFV